MRTLTQEQFIDARPFTPVRNPPTEDMILAAIQEAQQ